MSRATTVNGEDELDITLRPQNWEEYVGQEKVKESLRIIITAAKQRNELPEHILFYGNPGLGKTTLAYLTAKEIGGEIKIISAPAIEKAGDLAAILTNLKEKSVLFLDECHRLPKIVEEYLYPAMEEFKLNLILGRGPMARTMQLKLPPFTLIGATTKLASLSSPLRSRFGMIFGLDFYRVSDIKEILVRSSKLLNIKAEERALELIAKCSRFTPRVANHLLKRVRDYAQVKGEGEVTEKITKEALSFLEIDELGMTSQDRRILEVIVKKFNGGPVGLQALSAATSEEENTILEIYEPYLMKIGFIRRTPRGRVATHLAFRYFGIKEPPPLPF
jgi:Holliday junction DNA helicase RuvB